MNDANRTDWQGYEGLLDKEWGRARRERCELGLLIVDVDQQDKLAEAFGPQVIDKVASRVNAVIVRLLRRAADSVMSVGRAKFAVVMPNTPIAGAMDVAESVRKAVVAADFSPDVPGGHPVTVSVGAAAAVPLPGVVSMSLGHGAIAALEQARRQGGNRVVKLQ